MKRDWIALLIVAGGLSPAAMAQQYPPQSSQQDPVYQRDPNNPGPDDYDPDYDSDAGAAYDSRDPGMDAPEPPPPPTYAYQRPPMPGPGYYWVDGYWNFLGGRYSWVGGYWMLPPYSGGYWVRPRYSGGRYFRGFWGGSQRTFNRGFVRNDYRYQRNMPAPRQSYRAPAQRGSGFRGGDNRGSGSGNRGQRGSRR